MLASSFPVICLTTRMISAPPIRPCPLRNCAIFRRSATRQYWPMSIPTSQREFDRESRRLVDAMEVLAQEPHGQINPTSTFERQLVFLAGQSPFKGLLVVYPVSGMRLL